MNGLSASSPAVAPVPDAEEKSSAYLTRNVWIWPTGPVIGCTPTSSFAMTVGITRLITGRITRFSVATLPAEVAPAVALSDKYLRVFSRVASITERLLPFNPSKRASLVSDQRDSNNCDILFISLNFKSRKSADVKYLSGLVLLTVDVCLCFFIACYFLSLVQRHFLRSCTFHYG